MNVINKTDLKKNSITKKEKGYFIMIRSTDQEVILINKNRALKYIKQNLTELKGGMNKSIIIDGEFSISLSIMIEQVDKNQ